MSAIPHDYNAITLSVDPNSLDAACDQVNSAAQNISDALTDIMNSLSELRLSWTGDAADVADDFNSRWTAVTQQFYGSQAAEDRNTATDGAYYQNVPEAQGVINVLTGGVAKAAQNYADCEGAVKAMFQQFHTQLLQANSPEWQAENPAGPQTDTVDQPSGTPDKNYHTTAVNETGF
ncbi:WXG100 family type VII secretion target [Streptomyces sp. NPDC094038]|uniref:WXG100 family type VII secretion target n=1 Tax=Streptomyces sp. NPDC094038 TaxID=3366055 RepID=UPI003801A0DA